MNASLRALPLAALLLAPGVAWAKKPAIFGSVVDRNGDSIAMVNVSMRPGEVEIVSDAKGEFMIDYWRDEEGNRIKFQKRTEYTIEYFKVGYHPEKQTFYFKRGELFLEPVVLKEETIGVKASSDNIDPGLYPDRAQSGGGSYEGE